MDNPRFASLRITSESRHSRATLHFFDAPVKFSTLLGIDGNVGHRDQDEYSSGLRIGSG